METAYKYIRKDKSCVGERGVLAQKPRPGTVAMNKRRL